MAAIPMTTRTDARHRFEDNVRIQLLEQDADILDSRFASIDAKLSRIFWVSFSALLTFTGSAILLAYTIANQGS